MYDAAPAEPVPQNRIRVRDVALGRLIAAALWLLSRTWRLRLENPEHARQCLAGPPMIVAFWHNQLLPVPVVWSRLKPAARSKSSALTSTSSDGELIAQVISRFGIQPIRGSASRRGSTALREIVRKLKAGHDVGITPDGSRGPVYQIKSGLVMAAQLSGRPVVGFGFEFSSAWRLKSWDRFYIPKPFSTVRVTWTEPYWAPRTGTPEEFEAARKACEKHLMTLVKER